MWNGCLNEFFTARKILRAGRLTCIQSGKVEMQQFYIDFTKDGMNILHNHVILNKLNGKNEKYGTNKIKKWRMLWTFLAYLV